MVELGEVGEAYPTKSELWGTTPITVVRSISLGQCRVRVVMARVCLIPKPSVSNLPSALSTTILVVDRFQQSRDELKAADFVDPVFCQANT